MTTFGQEMRELAQEMTEEFSEELGMSTLRRKTGQTYDPDLGTNTPTYTEYTAYMVFTNIETEEVQNADYLKEHEKCVVAGDDLGLKPQRDDLVVKPDATSHRVVYVGTDQFSAAYIIHIEKKNA